jgi:hypothetical protein
MLAFWLYKIKSYEDDVTSSGMIFIPSFTEILYLFHKIMWNIDTRIWKWLSVSREEYKVRN